MPIANKQNQQFAASISGEREQSSSIISNENRHLQVLKITQPPMSGHATYFSSVVSSLLCLICKQGQHLASGAHDAPKLPQHLARHRAVILGKRQAGGELPAQELI